MNKPRRQFYVDQNESCPEEKKNYHGKKKNPGVRLGPDNKNSLKH